MRRNPRHTQAILRYYRSGHTLRETARRFGLTFQRVHQVVKQNAPLEMRPPHYTNQRRRA
jgi:hypothetical protein